VVLFRSDLKKILGMTSEYKSLYGVSDVTDKEDEMLMEGEIVRMRKDRIGVFAFLGNHGKVVSYTFSLLEKLYSNYSSSFSSLGECRRNITKTTCHVLMKQI